MERLCNLFQELLFPQAESIEDVTNEIVEILKNFSSIFLLVEIARTNQNPSIRNAALIFAYKFFCNNMDESDSITNDYVNELEKLKPIFFELLTRETKANIQYSICNLISIYGEFLSNFVEWKELFEFCIQLLEKNQIQIGLYLINLVYSDLFNDYERKQIFNSYSELCKAALCSDNQDLIMLACDGIETIVFSFEEDDEILQFPNLIESIQIAMNNCVFKTKNETVCSYLFGFISDLFSDRFRILDQYLPKLCEFVISLIDQDLPIQIRISTIQVLDKAPRFIPDFFAQNFEFILQKIIGFIIESSLYDREQKLYQSSEVFLHSLSSSIDPSIVFSYLYPVSEELMASGKPHKQQISLFISTSIYGKCHEYFKDVIPNIIPMICNAIASEDMNIMECGFEFLLKIIKYTPSYINQYLDKITNSLMSKLPLLISINTLDYLFKNSEKETTYLPELLEYFIQLLHQNFDQKDSIISCITSLISHSNTNEKLYSILVPNLISSLNEDPNLMKSIFNCFGTLSKISPESFLQNKESILSIIDQPNISINDILPGLYKMIKYNHKSMECQTIIDFLHRILSNDDFEEIDTAISRSYSIKCLSYFQPDEIFYNHINRYIHSIYPFEQIANTKAFCNSYPILSKIPNLDLSTLIQGIINEIAQLYDEEDIEKMKNCLKTIGIKVGIYE